GDDLPELSHGEADQAARARVVDAQVLVELEVELQVVDRDVPVAVGDEVERSVRREAEREAVLDRLRSGPPRLVLEEVVDLGLEEVDPRREDAEALLEAHTR